MGPVGNDHAVPAAGATHGQVAAVGQQRARIVNVERVIAVAGVDADNRVAVGVGSRSEVGRHSGGIITNDEVGFFCVGERSEERGDAKRHSKTGSFFHGSRRWSRGVRRQKCNVTKKKGSRPWNLKKGDRVVLPSPLRMERGIYGKISHAWRARPS